VGVRSEAQLTHLLEFGFTYISADDEDGCGLLNGAPREDIVIPVAREGEGELIELTGVRPPLFATEDDVYDAFKECVPNKDWLSLTPRRAHLISYPSAVPGTRHLAAAT
jgi:hypothetical protein